MCAYWTHEQITLYRNLSVYDHDDHVCLLKPWTDYTVEKLIFL